MIVSPWAAAPVLSAIAIGIVLGLIWVLIARIWQRRSFAVLPQFVADRYDVLVDARFADEARRVVSEALAAPADRSGPPV